MMFVDLFNLFDNELLYGLFGMLLMVLYFICLPVLSWVGLHVSAFEFSCVM